MARLTDVLLREHRELLAMITACTRREGEVDLHAFDQYRLRQLRHVAIEEKVLLPALAERTPLGPAFQNGLRKDHETIVVLCVTAPDPDFVHDLQEFIAWHQRVEEQPGGLFELYQRHVGDDRGVDKALAQLPAIALPSFATGAGVSLVVQQTLRQIRGTAAFPSL